MGVKYIIFYVVFNLKLNKFLMNEIVKGFKLIFMWVVIGCEELLFVYVKIM